MCRLIIPAAFAALVLIGTGMAARPALQANDSFLAPLRVGIAVSVIQKENELAHIYIPTAEEAKAGGLWKITAVSEEFVECQIGTSVWRVPVHSISRISWSAKN